MKYMNTQSINASQISMTDIKKNLQDSYIATWREQLWNDIRQSGRNKLRTFLKGLIAARFASSEPLHLLRLNGRVGAIPT